MPAKIYAFKVITILGFPILREAKRRFRRNEVKTQTEFLYDSQQLLFMRFARLERAHYACACTDVRVSLSQCVHSVLTQLRERTLGCSRPHNCSPPPPPPPTTRSCAAQDCKAETSSIPRMPGEQWLYYVVSLIINLSFILLPWKSLQHLRRRDDDHAVKRAGDTRIARTSHRWLQNRRIPTIEPGEQVSREVSQI